MLNNNRKFIIVLLFLGLILRLAYIFTLDNTHVGEWDDTGWEIARNLTEGRGYRMGFVLDNTLSFRPPLFPLFLSAIFLTFGQNLLIVRFFLAILSTLNCLIIYLLAKKIFNPRVGLLALSISVFYPVFIYWTGYLGPETLFILLISLASLFIIKSSGGKIFYIVASGIFLGLSFLCKSVSFGLIFIFIIWLFFSTKNKWQGLLNASLMLLIVITIISPWVIRNYRIHHVFLLSSTDGGVVFYSANNPEVLKGRVKDFYIPKDAIEEARKLSEIDSDRFFYRKGVDFIKRNPRIYIRLAIDRLIRFWRFYPHITGAEDSYSFIHIIVMLFSDGPIIILGFLGLAFFYKKQKWQALLLIFVFGYFTIIAMLIRSSIRYRAPIMPFLIILASYALYLIYKKVKIGE